MRSPTLALCTLLSLCTLARAQENFNSPPISGELLNLTKEPLASFKPEKTTPTLLDKNGQKLLQVEFAAGSGYPNLRLPVPQGGWNLVHFAGVQIDVTNPTAKPQRVFIRIDNPGSHKDSPWNTGSTTVKPGETATLKVSFGEGGFPLDPTKVTAIQLFLQSPKEPATLLFSNLKAWGSAKESEAANSFSKPADRNTLVTPPDWLGTRPPVEGDWTLTFSDTFDGPSLDESKWSLQTWWEGLLPGQLQRYSKQNLLFENGLLRMKTEKRRGHQYDDPKLPEMDYTTGHIVSYDKFTQLYGYFEARVKLPTAKGLWPAFWLMPDRGPAAGKEGWKRESTENGGMEIDILEHITNWGPGRHNVAVHWDGYNDKHKQWGNAFVYYGPTPDNFHTFGLLWEPGKLTWFIDGQKKAVFENPRVGSIPCYLIANVQLGGWAGKDIDDAALPDHFEIDHIKVWQLKSRLPSSPTK